jgi:hypothetical protein
MCLKRIFLLLNILSIVYCKPYILINETDKNIKICYEQIKYGPGFNFFLKNNDMIEFPRNFKFDFLLDNFISHDRKKRCNVRICPFGYICCGDQKYSFNFKDLGKIEGDGEFRIVFENNTLKIVNQDVCIEGVRLKY